MAVFNRNGVNTNFIFIWSWLNLNALSLQRIFILPEYHFSQGSVTCTILYPAMVPAVPLIDPHRPSLPSLPFSVSMATGDPGELIFTSDMWLLLWFCPGASQLLWSPTGCSRTHRIGRLAECPPSPPPVVSLKRPILPPQKAGATSMSELPRCPDRPSVFAKRYERCPNAVRG